MKKARIICRLLEYRTTRTPLRKCLVAFLVALGVGPPPASYGQVNPNPYYVPERFCVVDIIPKSQTDEANQDSEPSIAVGTGDCFSNFVVHAFNGGWEYVSADGGTTWSYTEGFYDYDCTLDWSTGRSGNSSARAAYAAFLPSLSAMWIRKCTDLYGNFYDIEAGQYYPPHARTPDQPWVRVVNVAGNPNEDHIYVGFNDGTYIPGKTASVRYSLNGGTTWANTVIEKVNPGAGQDSPAVRLATSLDGKTVYALFQRWTGNAAGGDFNGEVVLMREDNYGASFSGLGNGTKLATGLRLPWGTSLGAQQLGSGCDVALDPRAPNVVYVAYTEVIAFSGTPTPVIRVRRSTDWGSTFSPTLMTVNNASLPALAVLRDKTASSPSGTLGMLYAAKPGSNLEVRFTKVPLGWFDATMTMRGLARWPNNNPAKVSGPYIGDYFQLKAVSQNFYGTFCASGDPKIQNFPSGVYYQRYVKVGTAVMSNFWLYQDGQLYADPAGTSPVAASIDPFFFCDIAASYLISPPSLYLATADMLDPADPLSGTNHFVWPALAPHAPPFHLQSSPVLGPLANWRTQTNGLVQANGQLELVPDLSQPQQYFRLCQDVADADFQTFADAGAGGTLYPSGIVTNHGLTSQMFSAIASNYYGVDQWYLDGVAVQSGAPTLTISNISAEHTLTVTFAPSNDVAVTVMGQPYDPEDFLMVSNAFPYTIDVENTGLQPVSGVALTNLLDPSLTFLSVTTSQGSATCYGNVVFASLGTLTNGAMATLTITVRPNFERSITDTVTVACNEFEPNLANNTATAINSVITPLAFVTDLTNQVANPRDTVTFNVQISGTPLFEYQWLFNDADIINATNATLTLTNVGVTNVGYYQVVVFQVGSPETELDADSQVASLTVGTNGPSALPGIQPISKHIQSPKLRRLLR